MASCEATGPCGIFCSAPSTVFTATSAWKFWTTPRETRKSAATKEIGSNTQRIDRVQSNQKLPTPFAFSRATPRMTATAMAMPVAAERKLCKARPTIWVKWDIVDSPEYPCQLVFVVNETAVFQDESGETAPNLFGLSGRNCWRRCIA